LRNGEGGGGGGGGDYTIYENLAVVDRKNGRKKKRTRKLREENQE
jgi:hypothetical protein